MRNYEIIENLKKEAALNKVSASYLFYGDRRVDLLSYALQFSKMIMTAGFPEDSSEKEEIERKIDNYQYPDVEVINKENENIKIDEVREIIYSAIESSYSSPKKIFILSSIENLRKESSNALLKILEEPPKDVYFILLSRTLNIIPTIKSRTVKFYMKSKNKLNSVYGMTATDIVRALFLLDNNSKYSDSVLPFDKRILLISSIFASIFFKSILV